MVLRKNAVVGRILGWGVTLCETLTMDARIRSIGGDEWRLWRSLRLRAVEESPDAFRSTLTQESAEADDWWVKLISRTADHPDAILLVAEADSDPVGMMFGRLDESGELLDVGAMWVDPELRRHGIGRALVDAAMEWARDAGARRAELWVAEGNAAAESLYGSIGFSPTGEAEPLRHGSDIRVKKLAVQL